MTLQDPNGRIAAAWWRALQPSLSNGERNPRGDRAALARLRRADLPGAMQDPATFVLFRTLGAARPDDLPSVALCAATLAAVRIDDRELHPARQLGAPPGARDDRAIMSQLRFRRLIEAVALEDRLTQFRRAIALARGRSNVPELAAACLDWSERRRQRWIFEYYAAGIAAPASESALEDTPA